MQKIKRPFPIEFGKGFALCIIIFIEKVCQPFYLCVLEFPCGFGVYVQSRFSVRVAKNILHNRGNAVFLHKDENGKTVGAEIQGTNAEKRYKGVAAGTSDSLFSVTIGTPTKAYVFESAIDLLSFRQLANQQKIQNSVLVSMAGLKPNSLKTLSERGLQLFACVDNDEAGRNFISNNNLTQRNHILKEFGVKDFNELLMKIKQMQQKIEKSRVNHPAHSHGCDGAQCHSADV